MSYTGKSVRLERIMDRQTGRSVIIPMDHGITLGPIKGLIDQPRAVDLVAEGGANAVLGHVGLPLHGHRRYGKDIGLIMHLSASTSLSKDPDNKVTVTPVEDAIRMGADAVSVHVNIGSEKEPDMLSALGETASRCRWWGMPLLAMIYPRGKGMDQNSAGYVKIAARAAAELGVDIVKTNYTGDIDSFKEVTEGCPVPVVVAGGPKMDTTREILQVADDSVKAGGAGVAIGRNVFQADDPTRMVRALSMIVHERRDVDEVLADL
ncbi:MAG: 2-amino-3,7-dideoxy-D-threo-hept-6-ulosonate synthase [Methanomassiliicoccales archaeon]